MSTSMFTWLLRPIYLIYNIRKLQSYYIQKVNKTYSCNFVIFNITRNLAAYKANNRSIQNKDVDKSKACIIDRLNFQNKEDAMPFYELSFKTLLQILKCTKNDEKMGFCKNRLYYIASRLNCPPRLLSERLAKRHFIYTLSFDWLEDSLNILLDMGVEADRIIRDLWVLKYHHENIHERLLKVKNMGVDNLYPWMVRCTDPILNRYIEIAQETKNILGNSESRQMYVANRLNISSEVVEQMYLKLPALYAIRVTKLKNFLDFLISEGFDVEDIVIKPRVLCASQQTVKQRLDKLRNLGLKEINLNVLCRSRKHFEKYCESLESATEKAK